MPVAFAVHLQDASGRPIRIVEYCKQQQIRLEGEDDSWPRPFLVNLTAADPITKIHLDQFFERQGWSGYKFTALMAGNDLRFVGDVPAGPDAPVALRAPSASGPAGTSISTAAVMRSMAQTLPTPTLISRGRLYQSILAQGGRRYGAMH